MNKKVLLPFTLSTLALFLNGCGGESARINEDLTKGTGVTSSTSCSVTADDCLQFVLDYPIAGLNFDCSSDQVHHFATKLDGNAVTGACKLGDRVNFYIQGEISPHKVSLGGIELDKLTKLKTSNLARIRLIDLAIALTGKTPTKLDINDETTRVAMALVKIFQSIGLEQSDNTVGDIQPTELTIAKKDQLSTISKDVGGAELTSGEYANILKPWLDVSQVNDEQAFSMLTQLLNLNNTGIWQAELPVMKTGSSSGTDSGVRADGFFGCNKGIYADCVAVKSNLLHSMGSFILLSDRQGYIIGYGQQWRGAATITNGLVAAPVVLINTVKPAKIDVRMQNAWLNPITQEINPDQPLHFSLNNDVANDLEIYQGKLINGITIPGTELLYRQLLKLNNDEVVDSKKLGSWRQIIGGESYKGVIDIVKANPSSYLAKEVFKTKANVKLGERYIFPLYATLNFSFIDSTIPKVKLGIVIDEYGNIRTDIRPNSTDTDMSGNCAKAEPQEDGTFIDEYGEKQYRVGTTGGSLYSTNDKSITVRMILSNPKFGAVNGAMFGLNLSSGTGAKININNLLAGQSFADINLTDFSNKTPVPWSNTYASYQTVYANLYDKLDSTEKNKYVAPTNEERELTKRRSGTVTMTVADQKIPACNAIKVKS